MHCRRVYLIVLGLLLAGVLVAPLFNRESEPEYEGKPLSYWLRHYGAPNGYWEIPQGSIESAMRKIGTNATPFLLEWIAYEPPAWKAKLKQAANDGHELPGLRWLADDKREHLADGACYGFALIGPDRDATIPALAHMATNAIGRNGAVRAVRALGGLGTNALAPLLTIFKTQPTVRMEATWSIVNLGVNALPALPFFIQCLTNTNPDVAVCAAFVLGGLKLQPDLVVPALSEALSDSRPGVRLTCAYELGEFGQEARPAVAALLSLRNDSNLVVRQSAKEALRKIDPAVLKRAAH